jgi:hypothetical protein
LKPGHDWAIFSNEVEAEAKLSQIAWQIESRMLEEIVYTDIIYSS